ncbi:hypothetical protein ACLOJK_016500 [Asimina triloba]
MLLGGKKSFQKTHYDILSVKEDASYDEIRASYRAAILDSHPDKLHVQFDTSDTKHGLRERFLQVQKAWEILGDSASRAVYDRELQSSRQDFEVADDVKLEEMVVDDSGEFSELFYQCRCGDYISIDSEELGEMGFFLERNGGKELQTISEMPASVVLPCADRSSARAEVRYPVPVFQPTRGGSMASGGTSTAIDGAYQSSSFSRSWSVFDAVKAFPSAPESLMTEIDSAISASEYSHSSSLLNRNPPIAPQQLQNPQQQQKYDARLADQAYKAGCAALTAGKLDEAVRSLQLSLSLCPPEKTSAIAKLQSLISLASQHVQKPS